jgi:hypothetical protein
MRIPLLPYRPARATGPRCVVCHDAINGDPQVRIRGMHFHRRCATYKTRAERALR